MSNYPMIASSGDRGGTLHLVGFTVGSEEYGLDILKVQEIIRLVQIATLPNVPEHVAGVINLRGRIIPIIDFRKRFRISGELTGGETMKRIVVVALGSTTVGFIVDSVTQVIKLSEHEISPTPTMARGIDSEAIAGVGQYEGKLLIILDVEQIDPPKIEEVCSLEAA